MRYLMIGHSFASTFAVEAIRRVDRQGEIVIVGDEPHRLYSRAMLHELLGGMVDERFCWLRSEDWAERYSVRLALGRRAESLDVASRTVKLDDGQELQFDKMLIACGGRPFIPPGIEGLDRFEHVYTFTRLDDAYRLREAVRGAENVVVLGAGLIGLQCAEGLRHLGVQVEVVELADQVLPAVLDRQAAELIRDELLAEGIGLHLSDSVSELLGLERVLEAVRLKSGKRLPCQVFVVAVGVRPNVGWLDGSGIEIDRGILVDEHLQTNVEGIYAAGDCAQGLERISGSRMVLPTIPVASKQGLIAGYNMAGLERKYDGEIPLNAMQFGRLQVISYGYVRDAEEVEAIRYFDEQRKVYRKVVLRNGRVVGALLVRAIDRAGLYRQLINRAVDVSGMKERLVSLDFGVGGLPRSLRDEMFTRPQ